MSDVINHRKDEKVQIYKTVKEVAGTRDVNYRQFIYDRNTYEGGGLWANARGLLSTEVMNSGLSFEQNYVQFILNRYNDIDKTCTIVYRYKQYAIESIDPVDFRATDIKVKAKEIDDTIPYEGDRFYE